ncbi:MAG: radical SAM family heme chaperone HemW [Flavobacteriaceae bacterium]|nr:radical SAM family heme chaperone HemW [Flavobacteriaceae bacterium]
MAGIYIHIPFCKQKCFYCDFHFSVSLSRKDEVLKSIRKELELRKGEITENIETIYFGGGTPSVLTFEEIQSLLKTIYQNYNIIDTPEITLEANPDDLNSTKIEELAATKINRLSIGIQSFFDEDLVYMNRAHTAKEAINCLSTAIDSFDNITIDLIYGIPNMTNARWEKNLETVFNLGIPHISAYALTVENGTALASFIKKGKYPPLDEKQAQQHFEILTKKTKEQNYIAYEISNFGKENYFSKHNTSYWQGKHYLGIGPSAHSYNGETRSWNVANNAKYIKAIQQNKLPLEIEYLSKNDRFNEMIMTGLRTIWGVSLDKVEQDFGLIHKENLIYKSQKHIQNKTLQVKNNILLITDKGKFLADGIASDLFEI